MSCCRKHHANKDRQTRHCRGGLRTLLFGMLAGVVVGLLFAPKTGSETVGACREMLLRKMPV
ncbi:MAG: YtxH domain-containing protein [Thermoleophilia bacterium]